MKKEKMETEEEKKKREEKEEKERLFKERIKNEAKAFGKRMVRLREAKEKAENEKAEKEEKEGRKITPAIASEEMGIHVNALNNYEYDRFPQAEQLIKIKEYYNVSFDCLFGLTELQSTDEKHKAIHEVTGFLDENIDYVEYLKNNKQELSYVLNSILREDTSFTKLLSVLGKYLLEVYNADKSSDNVEETGFLELFRIAEIAKDIAKELATMKTRDT